MTGTGHPAAVDVSGQPYLRDAKGSLVPITAIRAADLLMDELVREMVAEAVKLSADIVAFKVSSFRRVGELQALIAQQYNAKIGGPKGNITLSSFDGCQKVQVQAADQLEFGPELEAAKALIDECLNEWAATSGAELRALVNRVFQVDQQGKISTARVLGLRRHDIADAKWQQAMKAIGDSMKIASTKPYIRFYERDDATGEYTPINLDVAAV